MPMRCCRPAVLAALVLLLASGRLWAWGCSGHEVVALIALLNLQKLDAANHTQVVQEVEALLSAQNHNYSGRYCKDLDLDPVAYFATWADDHRQVDPSTAGWHYWDIPLHIDSASAGEYCAGGCVTQALQQQITVLQDKNSEPAARSMALMYVIHFMGDMHQPLHAEDNNDRGGNCVPVQFLSTAPRSTGHGNYVPNLHGVWDTELVENIGQITRESAYAKNQLETFAARLQSQYASDIEEALLDPMDLVAWANESHTLAVSVPYSNLHPKIAPEPKTAPVTSCTDAATSSTYLKKNETINAAYVTSVQGDIERQLARAGGRLAAVLYSTLKGTSPSVPPAATAVLKFAVSGDSRNCGDIVMPAIAAGVLKDGAKFYWHLGDLRAIYDFDEDMVAPPGLHLDQPHLTISAYLSSAWPDFIKNQLTPFGNLEKFIEMGNHETIPPKTREDFLAQFGSYLDTPRIHAQREQDDDTAGGVRTYYHWVMNSVDFLSLDNASDSTFDAAQMAWIRTRLGNDENNSAIKTVVVGMHEALPGSVGLSHSMCDSADGIATGREVYELLWKLQAAGKHVYVLASHSHFIVEDVYRTPYWKDHVLPGWIVGTAGAVRYRLPPGLGDTFARTDVYGYLIGTVMSDGSIQFEFKQLSLDDLRLANAGKTPDPLVGWCFSENKNQSIPAPEPCEAKH